MKSGVLLPSRKTETTVGARPKMCRPEHRTAIQEVRALGYLIRPLIEVPYIIKIQR